MVATWLRFYMVVWWEGLDCKAYYLVTRLHGFK